MEEANRFLESTFLKAFNRRFAVRPRDPKKLERSPEASGPGSNHQLPLYNYGRNDNTARLGGLVLDIPPGPQRRSYAKLKVEAGSF